MAEFGFEFDSETVEPSSDRDPIPPGEYTAQIVSSEMNPTSSGTGKRLALQWVITDDGPYQNRRVFTGLNLENPNPKAVEIAYRELSSICRAVGKPKITDSSELHDLPCTIKVRIKPAEGQYGPSNEISAYKPVGGSPPPPPAASTATKPFAPRPPQPQQPAMAGAGAGGGGSTPPWNRK